jgi:hypothetical protein
MDDFGVLVKSLETAFGQADVRGEANRALRALRQSGTVAEYASKFRILSTQAGWNEQAKIDQYYEGLRDNVKDRLVGMAKPTTFDEWVKLTTEIDLQIQARMQERRATPARGNPNPLRPRILTQTPPSTRASLDPNAMDVDRLSQEERQRRRDKGLCYLCGKPGHLASSHRRTPTPVRVASTSSDADAPTRPTDSSPGVTIPADQLSELVKAIRDMSAKFEAKEKGF